MKSRADHIYRWCIAVMLLLSALHPATAANEVELFNSANKLYMDQAYEKSAEAYEKLIASGKSAPEVYFNLGNANYKMGNIAAAILNYERALRLRPSDPDIEYNLRMANHATIDKIEPVPQLFYERWWDHFVNEGSIDKRGWIGVSIIWLAFAISMIYLFSSVLALRKTAFYLSIILLFSGLCTCYLTYLQNEHLEDHRAAIIFASSAFARSSPDEKSANLFLLHAGTRIEVLDELQGWKKIRIANGNEGWIEAEAIEII